jgi:hypothetical protein
MSNRTPRLTADGLTVEQDRRLRRIAKQNVDRIFDQLQANPENPSDMALINREFVSVITAPGCTSDQYEAALHAYIASPLRRNRRVCTCRPCKATTH